MHTYKYKIHKSDEFNLQSSDSGIIMTYSTLLMENNIQLPMLRISLINKELQIST
jgi:hypothetical protein